MRVAQPDERGQCALVALAPPEPWWRALAVWLGFLLVGVTFTWPMAQFWSGAVIQKGGVPVDSGQGIWNLWWGFSALRRGWPLLTTGYLYFPQQVNLFWQPVSLPSAIMVAPIIAAFGPVAGFNAITLLSFAIGGYASYRLARAVGLVAIPALLVGFVVIASPYHLQRILGGSMELIAMQWLPLYALAFMQALASPSPRMILAAAGALLLTTFAAQYYGLFSAIYSLVYVTLAALLAPGRTIAVQRLGVGAAITLIWVATLVLYVWPLDALGSNTVRNWHEMQVFHSMALVDLFPFNMLHPLWGPWATRTMEGWHLVGVEVGATFGFVVLGLVVYACLRAWQRAWPWLLLALSLLILALGPELKLSGQPTGLPLPFLLLDLAAPFRNASRPSLFVALALLPLGLLAGLGLQLLLAPHMVGSAITARSSAPRRAFATLLIAAVIAEYLVAPWTLTPITSDPRYASLLQADPTPGALLELPLRTNVSQPMLNQLCHGRPLAGGYLARIPIYAPAQHVSALYAVWHRHALDPDIFVPDLAADLAALGIRYVTLDRAGLDPGEAALLREQLSGPGLTLIDSATNLDFFAVEPAAARPALYPRVEDWERPEDDGRRRWRWMADEARLGLLAPWSAPLIARFEATAFAEARPLELQLGSTTIATSSIPVGAYRSVQLLIPPGEHVLTLRSSAALAPEGRRVSLAVGSLAVRPTLAGAPAGPRLPTLPAQAAAPCQMKPAEALAKP